MDPALAVLAWELGSMSLGFLAAWAGCTLADRGGPFDIVHPTVICGLCGQEIPR